MSLMSSASTTSKRLKMVDEVRTFPSLAMPPPISDISSRTSQRRGNKTKASELSLKLNKLKISQMMSPSQSLSQSSSHTSLTTSKVGLKKSNQFGEVSELPSFVGFNASNLVFDSNPPPSTIQSFKSMHRTPSLAVVDVNQQVPGIINNESFGHQQTTISSTLIELRNYSSLMDQYSLHNFLIWNGKTLKNTPEFQSFRRTYDHDWGPISTIIAALEVIMTSYDIRLAIVNGQKTAEYALYGLPYHDQNELLKCVSNIDQIRPMITSFIREGGPDKIRAIIKIQSVARQLLAKRKYKEVKARDTSAIRVQSILRMFIQRCRALAQISKVKGMHEEKWKFNSEKLKAAWNNLESPKPLLLIHIPSIQTPEIVRLNMENMAASENASISSLYQLNRPNIHILYICPCMIGVPEQIYHEKFLQVLGISTLPKRLKFMVPDMIKRLPSHLPLSNILWYCSATLRKIKKLLAHYDTAIIIPSSVGWAEKRISNYLGIPLLAPDSNYTEIIRTRSFAKQIFLESFVNIPLGAHDISTEDDFVISLSRLIASNLDVNRWIIRINSDVANETVAYLDASKLNVVHVLRSEQQGMLQRHHDNAQAWFSKHVQASARKRLATAIQSDISSLINLTRTDIYPNWSSYLVFLRQYGAAIEAEPPEILGYVEGLCFIEPTGQVRVGKGLDCIFNEHYQPLSVLYPQSSTPPVALQGAVTAIANRLHQRYGIVGFFTVSFVSFWDAYDSIPRLWAQGLSFGMSASFGGVGTLAVALREKTVEPVHRSLHMDLLPDVPEGRCGLYIPSAVHTALRSSRDDVFFRLCKLNGVAYDANEKLGTLFFLVDGIVGGVVSILCIGTTRIKTMEIAAAALAFIANNFGRNDFDDTKPCHDLNSILLRIRWSLKRERVKDKLALRKTTISHQFSEKSNTSDSNVSFADV